MKKLILIAFLLTFGVSIGQIIPKVDGWVTKGKAAPTSPVDGEIYYNSTSKKTFQWNGTAWIDLSFVQILAGTVSNDLLLPVSSDAVYDYIAAGGGGNMLKSENLSGLTNYTTARTNLGVGGLATANTWSQVNTFTSPINTSRMYTGANTGTINRRWDLVKNNTDEYSFGWETGVNSGLYTILYTLNETGTPSATTDLINKSYADANYLGGGGDMLKSENLSGLTNYTTARTNLGVLPLSGGSMTGDISMANNDIFNIKSTTYKNGVNQNTLESGMQSGTNFSMFPNNDTGFSATSILSFDFTADEWRINGNKILTSTSTATPADNSVTSAKILDGTIINADIANGVLSGTKFLANTIAGDRLQDNTLTGIKMQDGIITSAKILDGTIVNADINASAAIDASKLANTPSGNLAATTVQGALNELQGDINTITSAAPLQLTTSRAFASTDLNRPLYSTTGTELSMTVNTGLGVDGDILHMTPLTTNSIIKPVNGTATLTNSLKTSGVVGESLVYRKLNGSWVGDPRHGVAYSAYTDPYSGNANPHLITGNAGSWYGSEQQDLIAVNVDNITGSETTVALAEANPYGQYLIDLTSGSTTYGRNRMTLTSPTIEANTTYVWTVAYKMVSGSNGRISITGPASSTGEIIGLNSTSWATQTGTFTTDATPTNVQFFVWAQSSTGGAIGDRIKYKLFIKKQ